MYHQLRFPSFRKVQSVPRVFLFLYVTGTPPKKSECTRGEKFKIGLQGQQQPIGICCIAMEVIQSSVHSKTRED